MTRPRLRALVLAAGRGRRLRPLTQTIPKPLLPVTGRPVAGYTLSALAALGCEATALNLHHLADRIRREFGARHGDMALAYSEEESLLGTLGALAPLRRFLAPAELILVVNGDSLCRWPLRRLVRQHRRSRAEATLLVSRRAPVEEFGGGLGIDRTGRVVSVVRGSSYGEVARWRVFAGAHALSPRLLDRLGEGPADFIRDLYEPMLAEGCHLHAVETFRSWHDLGTPRRYLEAARGWDRSRSLRRWIGGSWVGRSAGVARGSRVRRSAVEGSCRVLEDSLVERSLLLPGARLGRGCRVRESIVGPGVELPAGTWVEHRLITLERPGQPPDERDSVVGGLVYTPLD